jgi:hypothetical protein
MTPTPTHERLAHDLPYGAAVASTVEDDPYERGGQIAVLRSIRDDPLAGLLSRGYIDRAQFEAGRRWQSYYERAGIGMVVAMDTTREPVDGHGPSRTDLTDSQVDAFRELMVASDHLGMQGNILVQMVLGQGVTIQEICRRRGDDTEWSRKYWGRRLRECLETLAELWGFVSCGNR